MENEEVKEVVEPNIQPEPAVETPKAEQPLYEKVANGEPLTNDKVNQLFSELLKIQQNQQIIINQSKKEDQPKGDDDVIKY